MGKAACIRKMLPIMTLETNIIDRLEPRMRAEIETIVAEIQQAVGLLRRYL
jgi:hypothetical protein